MHLSVYPILPMLSLFMLPFSAVASQPATPLDSALPNISADATTDATTFPQRTIHRFDIDGVFSSTAGLMPGARILVGPAASGPLLGHEGELAAYTKAGWVFHRPGTGDQAYDRRANAQYLHTDDASLFGGLWIDSRWRRLTPERPRWVPAGVLGRDQLLTSDNHGDWFFVSAHDDDFTITLPNPFAGDLSAMGMEVVLEPFDGASGTAFLEVQGGGLILGPDGETTTRYALPWRTGRSHIFRAVAGHVASGAAWYLVAGP